MRLLILPCLILPGIAACAAPSGPSSSGPRMPVDLASALDSISADDLLRHTKTLASDEYEGRGPGTKGEELTVKYLTEQFSGSASSPATPTGLIVQKVPLVGFTARAARFSTCRRQGESLEFPDDYVAVSRRFVPESKVENSDVVFVGYGVVAPEYGWDDYKGVESGQDDRDADQRPGGARRDRPGEARREDVQGQGDDVLRPLDVQVRDRVARRAPRPPSSSTRPAPPVTRTKSSAAVGARELRHRRRRQEHGRVGDRVWITLDRAKELFDGGRAGLRRAQEGAATKDFKPVASRMQGELRRQEHAARDRVAATSSRKLEGSDASAQERVRRLHRALGSPRSRHKRSKGDQIYQRRARQRLRHGAAARDRRGLHEAADAARAIGPLPRRHRRREGSARREVLRDEPLYPLNKTLANINMDGVNQWGRTKDITIVGHGNSTLDDLAREVARVHRAAPSSPTPSPRRASTTAPTTSSSPKQGVPALYSDAGTEYIGKDGGVQQAEARRVHGERLPQAVGRGEAGLGSVRRGRGRAAALRIGYRVAQGDEFPEWKPGTEFKAKRDAMMKAR